MQAQPSPKPHVSGSSATATNSCDFTETLEYSRFIEFCNACRQYRYIGLCFGAPGIGKTLSAQYSRRDEISGLSPWTVVSMDPPLDTVLYTPPVVNTPGRIDTDLRKARETLFGISALRSELRQEKYWIDYASETTPGVVSMRVIRSLTDRAVHLSSPRISRSFSNTRTGRKPSLIQRHSFSSTKQIASG